MFASGNKAEIRNVVKGQCKNFANDVRARITAVSEHASAPKTAEAAPAPVSNAGGDIVDQLERLAKLKEQGILTEEEFEAQKQKILNG
ncbi:MAG: SHOCT domain-containing protein [Thermoleophilia bacterium]|nr:SHOCT domain-containing protein [Thermoleophilia bacterium]